MQSDSFVDRMKNEFDTYCETDEIGRHSSPYKRYLLDNHPSNKVFPGWRIKNFLFQEKVFKDRRD